ncbi:aminotransferase class IV [Candidatus Gracilibacteria bacterium]|nr:aminotransferase class IV [Candidatus Gracilibacteria bacterium]
MIQINGKFTDKLKYSEELFRGFGLFETMLILDKEPQHLKLHLRRLYSSCKKISLKPRNNKSQLTKLINQVAKKSPHKNQRIKVVLTPCDTIITSTEQKFEHKKYKKGVKLLSITQKREIPEIKSISYIASYLSHEKAVKKGYYDALLIDEKQQVYESAYANIWWFEGNTLCTRETEILPGITRQRILKKSPHKFKNISLKQLLLKKEIFITSSISGIVPVTKIDKTKIGTGKPGAKTKELIKLFKFS